MFRDRGARRENLDVIADADKKKFRQQSALISLRTSCVTF
jgi:hypothetical protein